MSKESFSPEESAPSRKGLKAVNVAGIQPPAASEGSLGTFTALLQDPLDNQGILEHKQCGTISNRCSRAGCKLELPLCAHCKTESVLSLAIHAKLYCPGMRVWCHPWMEGGEGSPRSACCAFFQGCGKATGVGSLERGNCCAVNFLAQQLG